MKCCSELLNENAVFVTSTEYIGLAGSKLVGANSVLCPLWVPCSLCEDTSIFKEPRPPAPQSLLRLLAFAMFLAVVVILYAVIGVLIANQERLAI